MIIKKVRRLKKRIVEDSGFTLVELLVVVAMVGVLTIPVTMALNSGFQLFADESDRVDMQNEGKVLMDTLVTKVRKTNADQVVIEQRSTTNGNKECLVIDRQLIYFHDGSVLEETPSGISGRTAGTKVLSDRVAFFNLDNIETKTVGKDTTLSKFDVIIDMDEDFGSDLRLETTIFLRSN